MEQDLGDKVQQSDVFLEQSKKSHEREDQKKRVR